METFQGLVAMDSFYFPCVTHMLPSEDGGKTPCCSLSFDLLEIFKIIHANFLGMIVWLNGAFGLCGILILVRMVKKVSSAWDVFPFTCAGVGPWLWRQECPPSPCWAFQEHWAGWQAVDLSLPLVHQPCHWSMERHWQKDCFPQKAVIWKGREKILTHQPFLGFLGDSLLSRMQVMYYMKLLTTDFSPDKLTRGFAPSLTAWLAVWECKLLWTDSWWQSC